MESIRKKEGTVLINNKLSSAKTRISLVAVLSVAIFLISYSLIAGIEAESIPFACGLVLFTFYLFWFSTKPHYIYLAEDSSKIILRFYNSHPFMSKPRAIVIPKASFKGFEIEKSLFGFRKDLYLIQLTPNGEVKYPSVVISLLNNKELNILQEFLTKMNKKK